MAELTNWQNFTLKDYLQEFVNRVERKLKLKSGVIANFPGRQRVIIKVINHQI